ncbi:hypothetical protein [Cryobacterium sp. GrIS_2_6]|uniref:hypothetical protein n=1 Tax=Cryobacterium sp. GrIS_2_6 TaxID=3162785 RepID=UPI002DFBADEE|nr:hypothetical protein [Cryobacterium psychrotolerans]
MALTPAQRAVSMSGLRAAREFGFALAGSGALIEHGIASRRTDDADWFSTMENADSFGAAVDAVTAQLERDGFTLNPIKRSGTFFKFGVVSPDGEIVEVDMSLDWRRFKPAEIAIGPVLNIQDAAAAKVATIYSRGEARDFIDLWSIRASGLWSDCELFAMAKDRDDGIDVDMFLTMLAQIERYDDRRFSIYGLTSDEILQVRAAAVGFGLAVQAGDPSDLVVPDHSGQDHVRAHPRGGSGVRHYWRTRRQR